MSRASSLDLRAASSFFARVAAVLVPPMFLASALLAAPKTTPPKKTPPVVKTKDAAPAEAAVDAPVKDTGKEAVLKPDAAVGGTKISGGGDSGEMVVRESDRKEGDAAVKVFEFGTTKIEGRSRWPAVTYFVRRMRAEFDTSKLQHRPFLPELSATKGDPAVK